MTEGLETRILLLEDKEAILVFENERLSRTIGDSMEREMAGWNARWRQEALEHYLPLGWSFGSFLNGKLQGYVLGQPFVFLRGLMQTLWIENLASDFSAVNRVLIETAHRWARDKHLQCLLMELGPHTEFVLTQWPQSHRVDGGLIELKSAKY